MSGYPAHRPARASDPEAHGDGRRARAAEGDLFGPFSDPAACTLAAVAEPERLLFAFRALEADGGHAPGPDGLRFADLGPRERAALARDLSRRVRRGRHAPGPTRAVVIGKPDGGTRTIRVANLVDRVVAKAAYLALSRAFDPTFAAGSYGFRPGRSHHHLLADLELAVRRTGRHVLAVDDVRGAFDHVPTDDALAGVRRVVEARGLQRLVGRILRAGADPGRAVGIAQGCPLSPLALNIVLHAAHDAPLDAGVCDPPWFRYADNLAYLAQDVPEGRRTLERVGQLLSAVGLALKGADGAPVDLRHDCAKLLGFDLSWADDRLRLALGAAAWQALDRALQEAHRDADPHRAAGMAVTGWTASGGPAFESRTHADTLDRIVGLASRQGHRELSRRTLQEALGNAHGRWLALRQERGRGDGGGAAREAVLASPTPPPRAGADRPADAAPPGAEPGGAADY